MAPPPSSSLVVQPSDLIRVWGEERGRGEGREGEEGGGRKENSDDFIIIIFF